MTLATFVTWLVVAVVTGGVASAAVKYGGHGIIADVFLALTGGGVAFAIAAGIGLFPGLAATALVALSGAGLAIAVQRKFFHAAPFG
jgi:hypothetical protein